MLEMYALFNLGDVSTFHISKTTDKNLNYFEITMFPSMTSMVKLSKTCQQNQIIQIV